MLRLGLEKFFTNNSLTRFDDYKYTPINFLKMLNIHHVDFSARID